jgi:hypothetical protein
MLQLSTCYSNRIISKSKQFSTYNYNLRNSDFKFYLPKPKTEYKKSIIVVQNFGITFHPKLEILFQ